VEVRVARIFNTYGPKMHMYDGRVVSNFIIQALQNQTVTVFAPGNQSRSFMYISDLVEGMILLMNSNYSDPVNLGNPDEYTILDFAEIILASIEGTTSTIELLPPTQDDPKRRRPSIVRAKAVLGWEPKVTLKAGIQKTVDYFRAELQQQTTAENS
jgi:UDP-glucuronate decarboxylase